MIDDMDNHSSKTVITKAHEALVFEYAVKPFPLFGLTSKLEG